MLFLATVQIIYTETNKSVIFNNFILWSNQVFIVSKCELIYDKQV